MPSQPPPGFTGGSPRTPAPFQPAPGITGGIARILAALSAQAVPPGSTGRIRRIPARLYAQAVPPVSAGGTRRIPAALSSQSVPRAAQKFTVLVDWCLERVEGEEGKIHVAGSTFTPCYFLVTFLQKEIQKHI
ncbi:uncharacterized protein [Miscanthus floridulus]|uniref:uncharacterized protein isoform X1 n=2 Tax=Miscanthus floridulus TaxID=154761 RepID=UPI0034584369